MTIKVSHWLREPLFHFAVLGLLIFAIDRVAIGRTNDPRLIMVDQEVESKISSLFNEGRGRKPSEAELKQLIYRWIQNEVLYREALALGLDQGDEMIRERLILKMRMLVFNNTVTDEPTDDELRAWFEANRDRYDTPRRYDLIQFLLPDSELGSKDEADALAARLVDGVVPEPYADLVRSYRNRSRDNIEAMFGERFAAAIAGEVINGWQALRSEEGWRFARVVAVREPVSASFEAQRPRIVADWRDEQKRKTVFDALKEIRDKYSIRWEIER